MKVNIRHAKLVVPEGKTPRHVLWNSNIDLVIPRIHTSSVYFYKKPLEQDMEGPRCNSSSNSNSSSSFFNFQVLENALAKALVPFYPMAGRLLQDVPNGRIHIDCNAQGVLLVEAHSNATIDDFGDFAPSHALKQLIPSITYTPDISTYPLLLLQVTFFRCGGVSLGVGMEHHVADGMSGIQFINTWAELARTGRASGAEGVRVFIDRTLLRAREPPAPRFEHVEYKDPPKLLSSPSASASASASASTSISSSSPSSRVRRKGQVDDKGDAETCDDDNNKENVNLENEENMKGVRRGTTAQAREAGAAGNGEDDGGVARAILHLDEAQVMALRAKAAAPAAATANCPNQEMEVAYSTFEAVAAHVWRCVSEARELVAEQDTKLYIATDGRSRLKPQLPEGYFGNVIFTTTPIARVAELHAPSGASAGAAKIRAALARMDDEYLRSALDFLELQHPHIESLVRGAHTFRSPNLGITSWIRLPIYDADFGWGLPIFMGPAMIPFEGLAFILPPPPHAAPPSSPPASSHFEPLHRSRIALSITIALSSHHMPAFRRLFHNFWLLQSKPIRRVFHIVILNSGPVLKIRISRLIPHRIQRLGTDCCIYLEKVNRYESSEI